MKGIFAVACIAALVLWGLRTLPGWWTGRGGGLPPGSRHEREFLTMILFFGSGLGIFGVAALTDHGVLSDLAARILLLPLVAVGASAMLCLPAIYWFNQPKFLVPPRLRHQPGRWRQLRNRRRDRASGEPGS